MSKNQKSKNVENKNPETTKTPKTKSGISQLKELYAMSTVESKDMSLRDLLVKEGQGETVTIEVAGFGSKYVSKYDKPGENKGFHTMMYLTDGRKIGAFSNALHEFASFFFRNLGLDPEAEMNRAMLSEGDSIKVKIDAVKLDEGRTTYNFDIVDGTFDSAVKTIGGGSEFRYLAARAESEIEIDTATGVVIEDTATA